jgi:hypothetical protein
MRDCYTPYTYSELENIVSPQILKTLDPEKEYGIYWYNREYRKKRKVWSETKKKYITKVDVTSRPREEWIAVPIPESGIPREIVDKARANLADNKFGVSSSSNRYWELSGGIAVCEVRHIYIIGAAMIGMFALTQRITVL